MGFYIRAEHYREPGKHCVNLLFSPDAECRAFILGRRIEAKRRDIMVPGGTESPCLTQ